jgi:hypothetical protein
MTDPNDGAVVVLRHHTPRDGVEEFPVQVSKIMDGNELRKVLASKHIVTAKKNYDLLVDYVIRSIQQWVDSEKVEMMRTQFGWADGHSKFIIGDREISAEGTFYSPPSSATKALADHMRPTGSFEKWKEVFDLYGREGLEAHAFAAATAFGAPLLHISGQRGALINLAHSTSGAGKTTILHMCSSVWGDPVKLTSTSEDTHNSKVFKIGLFNSIPPCIDEMTNEDAKRVSELAYLITHGQGKDRMKASSNELRVNTTTWQTIALTTSNESFYDKLEALKRAPEGEMMRIIEIEIPHYDGVAIIDPEVGKAMFDIQLAQNYGFAGDIYAQYLVTHYEDVVDAYHEMQITIDREFKLTQRERFWSAVIAANLTGIRIAIRLGLCDWNLKRIYAYVRSLMQRLRTTTVAPPDDDRQLVGEFLNANMDSILIVKDSVDMRSNKVQFPTLEPKRELRVRYEPDTNTVYITAASFKRFCSMRSVNYRETLNKMKKSGMFIDSDLKRMAKGMKLNTPPVQALRFNASHSDFLALNTLLADKEASTEAAEGESP